MAIKNNVSIVDTKKVVKPGLLSNYMTDKPIKEEEEEAKVVSNGNGQSYTLQDTVTVPTANGASSNLQNYAGLAVEGDPIEITTNASASGVKTTETPVMKETEVATKDTAVAGKDTQLKEIPQPEAANTQAKADAVVELEPAKIDEASKTNAENQGIEEATKENAGTSPNEILDYRNPGAQGGIANIRSISDDLFIVTMGNGAEYGLTRDEINETYGISIPSKSETKTETKKEQTPSTSTASSSTSSASYDSGARYNNTDNPAPEPNHALSPSNSAPDNTVNNSSEKVAQPEEVKEENKNTENKEAEELQAQADAFKDMSYEDKVNWFTGTLAMYLGDDYQYDPNSKQWITDLSNVNGVPQAVFNNAIEADNAIKSEVGYKAEKTDKNSVVDKNATTQKENVNANADALKNYAKSTYDTILESNNKNYNTQVDEVNAQYKDSTDALDRNKNIAQQEASILLDRLNKYLPQQIKAQGLAGLGVSQSAMLKAQNQYQNQMGNIGANYNTNLTNLNTAQRQQLNSLAKNKYDADLSAYQDYSNNVIDIDNGRYESIASIDAETAKQKNTINNNYWNQVNANNSAYNDAMVSLYNGYVADGLGKSAAEAMAKAQAEEEARSKKEADAVSAKTIFNNAFNDLVGNLYYEDALDLVQFNYQEGVLTYGEFINYSKWLKSYAEESDNTSAINYNTDPRFTSN